MKLALELQPCLKNRSGIGIYTYELAKCLQNKPTIQIEGNIFNFLMRNDLTEELQGLTFSQKYCTLFPYGIYRRIWRVAPVPYKWLFGKMRRLPISLTLLCPKG